jgi:fatty acid desaturase
MPIAHAGSAKRFGAGLTFGRAGGPVPRSAQTELLSMSILAKLPLVVSQRTSSEIMIQAQVSLETPDLVSYQQALRKAPSKETVLEWMKVRPSRAYRDLVVGWLCIALAIAAAVLFPVWWVYILTFFVIGFSQYALFILGHDAIHWALHPDRSTNDLLSKWLIHGPMFMGLEDGRRNHLQHHKLLGSESDPDRYLHSIENKNSKLKLLLYCLGISTFAKTVLKVTPFGKLMLREETERPVATREASSESTSNLLLDYFKQRAPVIVTQPILIAVLYAAGLPLWAYPVLWVAPIYFCVFLPDEVRAFCDHAVPITPDSLADARRLVSFVPPAIEAVVFSPHNMNLHAEHHLWPSVPYYNIPTIRTFLKGRPEVTVRRSYVGFLFRLFLSLPLLPERPDDG